MQHDAYLVLQAYARAKLMRLALSNPDGGNVVKVTKGPPNNHQHSESHAGRATDNSQTARGADAANDRKQRADRTKVVKNVTNNKLSNHHRKRIHQQKDSPPHTPAWSRKRAQEEELAKAKAEEEQLRRRREKAK